MVAPFIPIAAALVGLLGIGSVEAKRRSDSKTLLLVGSPTPGRDAIVDLFEGTAPKAVDPWHKRVRERVNKLITPRLNVLVTDAPIESEIDVASDQVTKADIICLVVTTHEVLEPSALASSTRLAKLIGELADKKTNSLLVVNNEDSQTDTVLVDSRGASSTTIISDLIGASQVWEGNLSNPSEFEGLAETILSVLTNKK